MTKDEYVIRTMKSEEIGFAIDLAYKEGWNPGVHDAECFYSADPNGFLIGELDGEPISSLSVVRYGGSYGFLGLYIVKPEHRGKGYGVRIWNEGMKYLEYRDVGLDGVIMQIENYKQSGFKLVYYNTRYRGKSVASIKDNSNPDVVDLSEVPFDVLTEYDETLFPSSRIDFLRTWINQPDSIGLGIMKGSSLAGYVVLRKCRVGYKIGPLFADDDVLAEALYQAAGNRLPPDTEIFLDVPGEKENPAATELAKRHNMEKVFQTARMYRMWNPGEMKLPLHRWFGVTTFELG